MSSKLGSLGVCMVVLLHLVVAVVVARGAIYTVGDGKWTFDMTSWPQGKTFRAGDVLVFKYEPAMHNVVTVDRRGYLTCAAPPNSKVYQTGEDHIKLLRGSNYFICTFPGHCKYGMKIAVVAT